MKSTTPSHAYPNKFISRTEAYEFFTSRTEFERALELYPGTAMAYPKGQKGSHYMYTLYEVQLLLNKHQEGLRNEVMSKKIG